MTGSFISLAMSKWSAKRGMGVQIIEHPQNQTEQWLMDVVTRQARIVDIDTPEVGIFQSVDPNAFATGMTKNSSLVAVSTGLLQNINEPVIPITADRISKALRSRSTPLDAKIPFRPKRLKIIKQFISRCQYWLVTKHVT
jgi:hypothetical protein